MPAAAGASASVIWHFEESQKEAKEEEVEDVEMKTGEEEEDTSIERWLEEDRFQQRNYKTKRCIKQLKDTLFAVETMCECEFRRLRKANPAIDAILLRNPVALENPKDPSDAFFGGRTETIRMFVCVTRSGENSLSRQIPYVRLFARRVSSH